MSGKKPTTESNPKFQFIISNGQNGPHDPEVRKLIRKQAMRDVGLARRRRFNGRDRSGVEEDSASPVTSVRPDTSSGSSIHSHPDTIELGSSGSSADELPFDLNDPYSSTDESLEYADPSFEQALVVGIATQPTLGLLTPSSFIFHNGYDRARSRFGVDISSLSALTNFSISRTAISRISTEPGRLASLLDFQRWSFLDYIPARYDRSPCLAAATDCVLAKAVSVLTPTPTNTRTATRLYAKALRCVQDAISDPVASTEPEVLAAVKLLSLHELLDSTREEAWSHHVIGAARLIKHRSPSRFTSDFEKALLVTHAGAIVSETMVQKLPCYLEEPAWTGLLSSLRQETDTLTERSPLILDIRLKMLALPGLWHDMDSLMNSERLFDDSALSAMAARCAASHATYLAWLDEYEAHVVRASFRRTPDDELELRRQVFGTVCECVLFVKRFWACVAEGDRARLEVEAQALAKLILELELVGAPRLSWLFTAHEVAMAKAVFATRGAFEEVVTGLSGFETRVAARGRYNLLSDTMRYGEQGCL